MDQSIEFVVPMAPGVTQKALEALWDAGGIPLERQQENYALRVDAAIAVSGTATLELALWDVPTVLVYKSTPITMFLARRLVKLNCAGLANIILDDQPVMPELIQQDCTVEKIIKEILPLLQHAEPALVQREQFNELRSRLGTTSPAIAVTQMLEAMIHDGKANI